MNLIPFFSGRRCFHRPGDQNNDKLESTKSSKEAIRKKVERKKKQDKLLASDREKEEFEFEDDSTRFSRKYEAYKNAKAQSLQPGLEEDLCPPKFLGSTDGSVNDEEFETSEDYIKAKGIGFKDWEKILKNNDIDNTSHLELAEALRFGIPDELRPQIWTFLTKLEKLKKQHSPTLYTKLKNLPSDSDEQIQRDIGRTFGDHPFFTRHEKKGQQILFNILRAYANYDTEIGYTQGMNIIVGTLLIILDPSNYKSSKLEYFEDYEETYEEDAFWLFIHIAFEKNYRVIYKTDFPKLLGMIKNLENRIKEKAPEVEEHIRRNDFETFLCFHQLFISMLLVNTPVPISKRILDLFFIEEEKLLFKVLIRAVTLCKKEILELKDEKLRNFFDQQMMQLCYEKYKNRLYLLFPSAESSD